MIGQSKMTLILFDCTLRKEFLTGAYCFTVFLCVKVVSVSKATKRFERLAGLRCTVIKIRSIGFLDAAVEEAVNSRVPDLETNIGCLLRICQSKSEKKTLL